MNVKEYQNSLLVSLKQIFPLLKIKQEWPAEIKDLNLYSPRLDLAIGPFAINTSLQNEYDQLQTRYHIFIDGLIEIHNQNIHSIYSVYPYKNYYSVTSTNKNPRCFITIEIENKVSRKHLIGGAINASALGRIGLFIAFTEEKFRAMKKLEGYFDFLSQVQKNTFNTGNLLILSKDQFSEYLDKSKQYNNAI